MATLRELKGRIGSVASSEKITGAMKMISSAKMHKAEAALRKLVPYRNQIEAIISHLLASDVNVTSPLCVKHTETRRVAVIAFGSDEGLCGAYNANTSKRLVSVIADIRAQHGNSVGITVFPIGKKMLKAVSRLKDNITIATPQVEIGPKAEGSQVSEFVAWLQEQFTTENFDIVSCLYMKYQSAGRQILTCEQILPISGDSFTSLEQQNHSLRPYIFEPNPEAIFHAVVPLFLNSLVHEVFAQNRASEQAARVMAMQSANDNAKKLLEQLQLEFNKLRQQSITTELLDIVGGQVRD